MAKPPCDIRTLAQAHTEDAIATLAAVNKQGDASPAARVSAAIALLDRGWGKSTLTEAPVPFQRAPRCRRSRSRNPREHVRLS